MVGGPSIVFSRRAKVGEKLPGLDKKCQKIVGYDVNALYLWALDNLIPTGAHVRRMKEKGYLPIWSHSHGYMAAYWMDAIAKRDNVYIEHMFNTGEKRLTPKLYSVDGYDRANKTVFEMDGCVFGTVATNAMQTEISLQERRE